MRKLLILFVMAAGLLAACQPAQIQATPSEPPASPSATASRQPEAQPAATGQSPTLAAGAQQVGCTVVSAQPTPGPTEQSLFPAINDADHILGPQDAYVTLLELGDFQ